MKIHILHISDLHYSEINKKETDIVIKELLSDLSRLKTEKHIEPNLIFFTGDLINKGENASKELDLARKFFINPLLGHLKMKNDQFFIVPGNHEIDQTKTSSSFEEGQDKKTINNETFIEYYRNLLDKYKEDMRYIRRKLNSYVAFCSKIMDQSKIVNETLFYRTYKIEIQNFSIGIICLNSTWRSSQFGKDLGRLIIGEDIFQDAIKGIQDSDFKFVLAHHSFDMLPQWDQKNLKLAFAKNIDLFFTGHIHDSDFSYLQPIHGSFYVSTCASLFSGRISSGYSIIEIDCDKKNLLVHLRKWYPTRKEFDQETDKCQNGIVQFENFKCNKEETDKLLKIISIKHNYQNRALPPSIIQPFDGIQQIAIKDVFVDPMISDKSNYDESIEDRKYFSIKNIIETNKNIIFFSRKEFGKTTLLNYIQTELLLSNEKVFIDKIPVFISFSQIPKNNYRSLIRIIRNAMEGIIDDVNINDYLSNGNIVLLVDDFDNYTDFDREKKRAVFFEFCESFTRCRYILTMIDRPSQIYGQESFEIKQKINSENYYLCSFKTAGIRQLLTKWATFQKFDIELMLNQVLFYFQKLNIPVTPLIITLFVGVLIKEPTSKNINNEAYLIENYLETILEKLDQKDSRADLDFREKESFLAYIAYRMFETSNYELSKNDFEREKLNYYEFLGEDVPHQRLFDDFFRKQILQEVNDKISFKFRFWFNFFLAKTMQKDHDKKLKIIDSPRYLHFSTALGYKAGLDRNDIELLDIIDKKTQSNFEEIIKKYSSKNVNELEIEAGLIQFEEEIEEEIKSKNNADFKDKVNDKQRLSYDENDQSIKEDIRIEDVAELVTLNSVIIRNTREIDTRKKQEYIMRNVTAYTGLMWDMIDSFKEFIASLDKDKIKEAFDFKADKEQEIDIDALLKKMKGMVLQIIPISIILYMSDHLSHPKLKLSVIELINNETDTNKIIFYSLLLIKIDLNTAITEIDKIIDNHSSFIMDQIIFLYLLYHCYTNKLDEDDLNEIINLMNKIRSKHPSDKKKIPAFVKETFSSDVRQEALKRTSKDL